MKVKKRLVDSASVDSGHIHKKSNKHPIELWQEKDGRGLMVQMGIRSGQTVIDYGCASGNYTLAAALVDEDVHVIGVDVDEWQLRGLESKAAALGLNNITTVKVDSSAWPTFPDSSADWILVYDLIHSLYPLDSFLEWCKAVLKPGGILSIAPFHCSKSVLTDLEYKLSRHQFRLKATYLQAAVHFEMAVWQGLSNRPIEEMDHGAIINYVLEK